MMSKGCTSSPKRNARYLGSRIPFSEGDWIPNFSGNVWTPKAERSLRWRSSSLGWKKSNRKRREWMHGGSPATASKTYHYNTLPKDPFACPKISGCNPDREATPTLQSYDREWDGMKQTINPKSFREGLWKCCKWILKLIGFVRRQDPGSLKKFWECMECWISTRFCRLWPFWMFWVQGLSDLHLGDQKVTWKKLVCSKSHAQSSPTNYILIRTLSCITPKVHFARFFTEKGDALSKTANFELRNPFLNNFYPGNYLWPFLGYFGDPFKG